MKHALSITDVSKTYRSNPERIVRPLDGVSLSVEAGEFVAVQGPSGCGKTTLLLIAGGLLRPDAGEVRVDSEDLYALSADQLATFRAAKIGFVFQQFHLIPYLSVADNVLAPSLATGIAHSAESVRALVGRFGLESRIHHVPGELSTGERQRTAMARALLNQPKLLLADEPTGNLDRENAETILISLASFAREGGAVLMVTHEDHAVQHADRVIHLDLRKAP
jgi:ABC-type lipoprotein export system ATPase subunit